MTGDRELGGDVEVWGEAGVVRDPRRCEPNATMDAIND
jgi:hypothetical protein